LKAAADQSVSVDRRYTSDGWNIDEAYVDFGHYAYTDVPSCHGANGKRRAVRWDIPIDKVYPPAL
jgi:hypothetical protein